MTTTTIYKLEWFNDNDEFSESLFDDYSMAEEFAEELGCKVEIFELEMKEIDRELIKTIEES